PGKTVESLGESVASTAVANASRACSQCPAASASYPAANASSCAAVATFGSWHQRQKSTTSGHERHQLRRHRDEGPHPCLGLRSRMWQWYMYRPLCRLSTDNTPATL